MSKRHEARFIQREREVTEWGNRVTVTLPIYDLFVLDEIVTEWLSEHGDDPEDDDPELAENRRETIMELATLLSNWTAHNSNRHEIDEGDDPQE